MLLSDLLPDSVAGAALAPVASDIEVSGITADSRAVRPGYLFAALRGARADGNTFIEAAVRGGAVAVLAGPDAAQQVRALGVPHVLDANPRRRLALLAARFYGDQPRVIAAVTGTNGKTSVTAFTRQIWARLGLRAGSVGTLGAVAEGFERSLPLTTVDPVTLHETLAAMAQGGIDHVALEASSHGLDQHRLDGVRIQAAAFTNLSHEHLDYHGSVAAYFAAKAALFERVLPEGGAAVLNAGVEESAAIAAICRRRGQSVLWYGNGATIRGVRPDVAILSRAAEGGGQRLKLAVLGEGHDLLLPLAGAFQAMNAAAALGLAIATGADKAAAAATLAHLVGVRGRIELVARHASGAPIYVDYAHTPDALATVLAALRPHATRRLVVVFGCGGDRDAAKRPLMGEVANDLADGVIVTDDNPRGETPAAIRRAILDGCPDALEIGDRRLAIESAIATLVSGDVLVIAGKGHEQGQIVGERVLPFDDATVARQAVNRV